MAKLPVLWIGKETVDLIDADIMAVVRTSPASESDIEYIPAKRCKTCARFTVYGGANDGNPPAFCHYWGQWLPICNRDGSGFCHNHEEAT